MKTLMVTVAIILGSFQMFASDLVITSSHPKPFSIKINGDIYHSYRGEVIVRDLAPGNYRITVISNNKHHQSGLTQHIHIPARANVFATVYPNKEIETREIVYYRPQHKVYAQSRPACRETVTYRNGYSYNNYNESEYYTAPDYYYQRRR